MTARAERLHAIVRGRVQGVGFRWFVMDAAGDAMTGWVRNLRDGTVEVVAEGPRRPLEGLLEALGRGPAGAYVSGVTYDWEPAGGDLGRFEIRPTR